MILKDADDRSRDIVELKSLKQSAPARYQANIQQQIDKIYCGLEGERSAAHFLNREFGASERVLLLHDLRLEYDGDFAQIDHLMIHRIQGTAWILETKNYSGRLSCDEHGDWTIWKGKRPVPIPSPINQARRQRELLRLWLAANGIKAIHTLVPVVLISPKSSVNRRHLKPDVHVVKSDNFGEWFERECENIGLGRALNLLGRHLLDGMSKEEMVALGSRLAREHKPASYDWRASLRIPHSVAEEAANSADQALPSAQRPTLDSHGYWTIERALQTREIATAHGMITVSRLPDGRIAIRNEKNAELIDRVRRACKLASGKWNPRFSNWIISEEAWPSIVAALA